MVSQYASTLSPLCVDAVMKVINPSVDTSVDLRDIRVIQKLGYVNCPILRVVLLCSFSIFTQVLSSLFACTLPKTKITHEENESRFTVYITALLFGSESRVCFGARGLYPCKPYLLAKESI